MRLYNFRKNWLDSFELMVKNPIVLLPFMLIAFVEGLALEFAYFFPVQPISYIVNPIVKKFFGQTFIHYPHNLIILPKLFHYAQIAIYVFLGALLTAVSVNIVQNIRQNHPLKPKALMKNIGKRYLSFFVFGLLIVALSIFLNRANISLFSGSSVLGLTLALFLSHLIIYTFLIVTIPLMVVKNRFIFKALLESIALGWRNFLSIFLLICLPFLLYLPIKLLKAGSIKLIARFTPEITFYVTAFGILAAMLLNCFVYVCASQFVLDREVASSPRRRRSSWQ